MLQVLITILGVLLSTGLLAAPPQLREEILQKLPSELKSLNSKNSFGPTEKLFKSKISKKESETLYLDYFSKKNDVTLGFVKNHFQYALIQVPSSLNYPTNLFTRVIKELSPAEFKKVENSLNDNTHSAGNTLTVELPKQGLVLKFKNNDKKELHSILFWPLNGERP